MNVSCLLSWSIRPGNNAFDRPHARRGKLEKWREPRATLARCCTALLFVLLAIAVAPSAQAQDRLKSMPGYERYHRMSREIGNAIKSGALSVTWTNNNQAFEYRKDGKTYFYDIAARTSVQLPPPPTNTPAGTNNITTTNNNNTRRADRNTRRTRPARPERGRQYTTAISPDERFTAHYRDRNVWLSPANGTNEIAITTEGSVKSRIKLGTANWVYGEELFQSTAMWWSSNSQKLAFYRFDESNVQDYYLALDQTKVQSRMDVEPYMKAGATNPVVDILIYDVNSRKTVQVDVRSGKSFHNDVTGHYVYGVSWTADSAELLFHRTNRRQNIMELCAADPDTGKVRVIVREEWPASWTENSPSMRFLKDGQRFLWQSERTGWKNFYLYHLNGTLLAKVTDHPFEAERIEHVQETGTNAIVFYTARSGDNPMKLQLHRVSLNGKGDRRLTDPRLHHSVNIAPDGRHFIDVSQAHDIPPVTRLYTTEGDLLDQVAESNLSRYRQLGLKPVEVFTFKAADGKTDLYGMLHFPSNFQPFKKYPLLVSVYAGPGTTGARETFTLPSALTELGFLVASLDSRSASGRGKRFLDAIYQKLGTVEVDDQAAGVKHLGERRYVNRKRVGIYGTSYGGTVSALCLLRHPGVFQAACANSAVTDFRNYDTIYTERYMWIPQENQAGYDAGRVMNYATNLTGRLMIFYGTADDNVHPANAHQLIQALQKAGKSFEVQVGPDQGHTAVNRDRMMEFFVQSLVLE